MALTKTPIELSSTPSIVDGGNATAITIDSSENVLVGKTSTSIGTAGHTIFASGEVFHTVAGTPLYVNRTGSDGSIQNFYKDGAAVGSIGTLSGTMYIGNGDCNLLLTGATDQMLPVGTNGATKSGQIDLGSAGNRFKDLYLSGGVVFGDAGGSGTSSSNTLDSYEEGTWTPTDNGTANASINIISANYTKIGRLVNISMYVTVTATSTAGFVIGGLPFPSVSSNTFAVSPLNHNGSAGTPLFRVQPNSTLAYGINFNNTDVTFASLNGAIAITSVTYFTTA